MTVRRTSRFSSPQSGLMLGFSGFSCEAIVAAARRFAQILDEVHA
jgi:hypothetical protein